MRFILKVLLLLSLFSVPSWASIALSQCQNTENLSGSVSSVTINITTASGSFLFVWVHAGGSDTNQFSVTDSGSGTWTQESHGFVNVGGAYSTSMFYRQNAAAVTSVTVTATNGPFDNMEAVVCEVTGAKTSGALDTSVLTTTTSDVSSLLSNPMTTTNASDLLFYCISPNGDGHPYVASTGYAIPTNGASATRTACEFKSVSVVQSGTKPSMSWTDTGKIGAIGLAFAVEGAASPCIIIPSRGGITF